MIKADLRATYSILPLGSKLKFERMTALAQEQNLSR
jgi:hypothetical protein